MGVFVVDSAESDLLSKEAPLLFLSITDQIIEIRTRFLMSKKIMKTIINLLIALEPFGVIALGGRAGYSRSA